jgi:hypothetical protein
MKARAFPHAPPTARRHAGAHRRRTLWRKRREMGTLGASHNDEENP